MGLPDEVIQLVGRHVLGNRLCDLHRFCETSKALHTKLKDVRTKDAPKQWPVWFAVGPPPTDRSWREEWVDAWMERKRLLGQAAERSNYEAGGRNSIEAMIRTAAPGIDWKVAHGWPREQAEAYMLVSGGIGAPLAAAIRERSGRYAASTHAMCDALAGAARRLTEPAPPIYWNLTGERGLATNDPAWAALVGAAVGKSFTTNGQSKGEIADEYSFPDARGFCVGSSKGHTLQDSDVVCFRSAAADEDGLRSLIQVSDFYALPPLATVTLERVDGPGEWEANGQRVMQRLYTVRISFNFNA